MYVHTWMGEEASHCWNKSDVTDDVRNFGLFGVSSVASCSFDWTSGGARSRIHFSMTCIFWSKNRLTSSNSSSALLTPLFGRSLSLHGDKIIDDGDKAAAGLRLPFVSLVVSVAPLTLGNGCIVCKTMLCFPSLLWSIDKSIIFSDRWHIAPESLRIVNLTWILLFVFRFFQN